jgi:phosphoribosylanthranilate isomerase
VTPQQAAGLGRLVPAGVGKVGLFVDPDDAVLRATLTAAPLDMLQLHGRETPARVKEIRDRFGLAVMKAIKVQTASDVDAARPYESAVDWLLFDGVPPRDRKGALPGGNAAQFDWALLAGRRFAKPWMLSGGLDPVNVAEAIHVTAAPCVDVSSGVEIRPGLKDPAKIAAFVKAARAA